MRSEAIVEPVARIIIGPRCPLCRLRSAIANHGQPIIKRASATLQGGRPKATTVGPSSSPPATRAARARHAVDPHLHKHPPPSSSPWSSPSPPSGVRVRGWGRNESAREECGSSWATRQGECGSSWAARQVDGPIQRSWWVD